MKHLKSYESNNIQPEYDDFENFLIFKWLEQGDNCLALVEFNKIDYKYNQLLTNLIYSYDNELESHKNDLFAIFFEDLDKILYQSNDLDDCLKKIIMLKDTSKYNL